MKSVDFRREREASWRELEELIGRAEKSGIRSLTAKQLIRLPGLYRSAMSSLSVARSISLDRNVIQYLESLCARAYFTAYGPRKGVSRALSEFVLATFPSAVRETRYPILLAALLLALGVGVGFLLTAANEDAFFQLVPGYLAGGRDPTATSAALEAALFQGGETAGQSFAFSSFLFTHNAAVGLLSFALGFAFGVPVVLLMFGNGLTIGAFAALYASRDLSAPFWAWLLINGTTEGLAMVLCGGAGFILGGSLAFPGRQNRLSNLAHSGRRAGVIVVGAIMMFFFAGILESFGRDLARTTEIRYIVVGVEVVIWALYFGLTGSVWNRDFRRA